MNRRSLCSVVAALWGLGCESPQAWREPIVQTEAAPAATWEAAASRERDPFGDNQDRWDAPFEPAVVAAAQQHTFAAEGADFDPVIDPSGRRLAFASTRHSTFSHIYLQNIDSEAVTQLTDGRARDVQPAFSPDGKRLAFASDRGGNWDIWVLDIAAGSLVQITDDEAPEVRPSWSPDGRQLVYGRMSRRPGGGEIWLADAERRGGRRSLVEGLFPHFNPKEQKIVFQRARERGSRWFSIWVVDLSDGEPAYPTEVASSPEAALISPRWSPDGMKIAFVVIDPDPPTIEPVATGPGGSPPPPSTPGPRRADIGVVGADGRGQQMLTRGTGQHYGPAWATTGRLFYSRRSGEAETIWSIAVPANEPAQEQVQRTDEEAPKG